MKKHWSLQLLPTEPQSNTHSSYIGGRPSLPAEVKIPHCTLCGRGQTFFFQVAFPDEHVWSGLTVSVFQCTDCATEEFPIPEMLAGCLKDIDIPEQFLRNYQINFKFLVYKTGEARIVESYEERIVFRPWNLVPSRSLRGSRTKVGGSPTWMLADESPRTYAGSIRMHFLMQLESDFEFSIHENAPQQARVLFAGSTRSHTLPFYRLFLQNGLYLFGTELGKVEPLVYCITQVD